MKVLLIAPPSEAIYGKYKKLYRSGFLSPPIHLCGLDACVEQAGHEASIIDGDAEQVSIPELVGMAVGYEPDLIGITATSIHFYIAKSIIAGIKKRSDTPIVLGGTHINIFREDVLKDTPDIDYGCLGDGEQFIIELLEVLESKDIEALSGIKGLIYRRNDEIIVNPDREIETNLDKYPIPSRHLIKNELYYRAVPGKGYVTTAAALSSRGCPFNCNYCAVEKITNGRRVRLRSAENVLDELDFIANKLNIHHIAFNDDCLTISKKRIYEICDGIHKRGLDITWEGLSRADCIDRDILSAMKKAGFVRISIGIESGNQYILDVLNKQETLQQIEEAVRIIKDVGIVTRGSIIIGSPYETLEKVHETFRFIKKIPLDQVAINVMQPYPGTKIRDMIMNGEGGSRFISDPDDFDKMQRFGSANHMVNDLTPEKLVKLQQSGFLSFYIRPKTMWNNFRIYGINAFMHDGINFFRSIAGI